ncbi:MAG: hypothetical protein ABIH66_13895 [bacterium]
MKKWISPPFLIASVLFLLSAFLNLHFYLHFQKEIQYETGTVLNGLINFGMLVALICTVIYAKRNLEKINKANEISKNQLTITNWSKSLNEICLGILYVYRKRKDEEDKSNAYAKEKYNRIKENGFYDGVRALLGDMMELPSKDDKTLDNDLKSGRAEIYFRGATRYGITWDYLFKTFHKVCRLMDVPSGLEPYILENKYKHEFHTSIELPKADEGIKQLKEEFIQRKKQDSIKDGEAYTAAPMTNSQLSKNRLI